jgi:protein O-mannosyl-transferase
MSRKQPQKDFRKPSVQKGIRKNQAASKEPNKKPLRSIEKKQSLLTKQMGLFIFFVTFLIYAQTLKYDFTLDDRIVVFENKLTTQGIKAIPTIFTKSYLFGSVIPDNVIYRPISKSVFALCWSISKDNPWIFHFASVLFYALTGLILFLTLVRFFPKNLYVPLITTLLFITHPIHTEVVDNVKSLDEILCFLFFIISLYFVHSYITKKKLLFLIIAAFSFFISFLSKESGIAYLAVFPLIAFYTKCNKTEILKITGTMVLITALVFLIRLLVLGSSASDQASPSDNILAGSDNFLVQRATAIYLMGKYLLLLIFPHPLVCDYSAQQISLISPGDWRFIISLLVFLALFVFAILRFMKRDWISFSILFFLISFSVTSNIFIIGGTHFAERFMYAPSLGFCLAIAILIDKFINKKDPEKILSLKKLVAVRPLLFTIMMVISVLFVIKTMAQNPVWKNNVALFEHGIKYSPKSFRTHIALAEDLTNEKYLAKFPKEEQLKIKARAIREIKTSLTYFNDIDGYDMLGNIFYVDAMYDSSYYYYHKGLGIKPEYEALNYHMGKVLDKMQRYNEAITYLNKAIARNPKDDGALFNLGLSYTNMGDNKNGLKYFLQITQLKPERADAWYYAGLIYNATGDKIKGKEFLDRVAALGGVKNE